MILLWPCPPMLPKQGAGPWLQQGLRAARERHMGLLRRQFLHLTAGAAAWSASPRVVRAETYPVRPVRIIVGYTPGGSTDIVARVIGQQLQEQLGQPFVIENRP